MLAKPEPRKRQKARRKRREAKVVSRLRAELLYRDGSCRVGAHGLREAFGGCRGAAELAHFCDYKRFKTRGMDPDARHPSHGALMLCSEHHRVGQFAYDRHTLRITPLVSERGADGPLRFEAGGCMFEEAGR